MLSPPADALKVVRPPTHSMGTRCARLPANLLDRLPSMRGPCSSLPRARAGGDDCTEMLGGLGPLVPVSTEAGGDATAVADAGAVAEQVADDDVIVLATSGKDERSRPWTEEEIVAGVQTVTDSLTGMDTALCLQHPV